MGEFRIEKLLNNGFGMARDESGRIIFVPDVLPDERVRADRIFKKKGTLWAEGITRLEDSPLRVSPDCPHRRDGCGGCALLHTRPEGEAGLKQAYVIDVLTRLAKLEDPLLEFLDADRRVSRYRGKLHMDREGRLGFRERGEAKITDIEQCMVLAPRVAEALPKMKSTLFALGFQGEIWFAADNRDEAWLLSAVGTMNRPKGAEHLLLSEIPHLKGVSYKKSHQSRARVAGEKTIKLDWNGRQVNLEADQFFQSNPNTWKYFHQIVHEWETTSGVQSVLDLYAGSGFLITALTHAKARAVEPDNRAQENLQRILGDKDAVFSGTAETYLEAHDTEPVDGILLDPPRAGLSKEVRAHLLENGPDHLLYFSCDLGSFARDLGRLTDAYSLQTPIRVMNPAAGTLRVETAVGLKRK